MLCTCAIFSSQSGCTMTLMSGLHWTLQGNRTEDIPWLQYDALYPLTIPTSDTKRYLLLFSKEVQRSHRQEDMQTSGGIFFFFSYNFLNCNYDSKCLTGADKRELVRNNRRTSRDLKRPVKFQKASVVKTRSSSLLQNSWSPLTAANTHTHTSSLAKYMQRTPTEGGEKPSCKHYAAHV